MDNQKIIFVDVDDVSAFLMHGWLARYNRDFDDTLTKADLKSWNLLEHVKPECGPKIYDYLHDKTLYDDVPPIEGALDGVRTLRELGLRVVFATASNCHMAGRKSLWLQEHGFLEKPMTHGTTTKEVVELYDKSLLRGWGLVDDGPHNFKDFVGQRILFDQQHNHAALPGVEFDYRALNWVAVTHYVALQLSRNLIPW